MCSVTLRGIYKEEISNCIVFSSGKMNDKTVSVTCDWTIPHNRKISMIIISDHVIFVITYYLERPFLFFYSSASHGYYVYISYH